MNNIRIMFHREAPVKFISHLDILKVFERSIRRADINIMYTQGFNPHPKMVFALPLSVGIVSESEYADIEVNQEISPEEFKVKLNLSLPNGVKIIKAESLINKSKIMAQIKAARYRVILRLKGNSQVKKEDIDTFMKNSEIMVEKKTKKGIKIIDLKPLILEYNIDEEPEENSIILDILVKAGQEDNLKPQLLVNSLPYEFEDISIIRKALFAMWNKVLIDPMDKEVMGYLSIKK